MILNKIKGVIHVGASEGQERNLYNNYSLNVLWIEPIPQIYQKLQDNIKKYPKQVGLNYLVTDKNDQEYDFYISNNNGESSSILELNLHKKTWPGVKYVDKIRLKSKILPSILKENNINIDNYDAMILDTQGSELLILKSSVEILHKMKYVSLEVADFDSYKGCCKLHEVDEFFDDNGFKRIDLKKWRWGEEYQFLWQEDKNRNYYDATYERVN
jgi:FkbM family methyltransferase